jgi:hypothetical protein
MAQKKISELPAAGALDGSEDVPIVQLLEGVPTTVRTTVDDIAARAAGASIPDGSLTNAKLADVSTATLKGRVTSGTGVPEDLTPTQARQLLGEKVVVLTDGANIAIDAALANNFRVTLGGNRTLDNPTNLIDGQVFNVRIIQDGTGSRTLAYGSLYKFPGGVVPTLSTAANAKDFLSCQYDATGGTLFCVLNKGFA